MPKHRPPRSYTTPSGFQANGVSPVDFAKKSRALASKSRNDNLKRIEQHIHDHSVPVRVTGFQSTRQIRVRCRACDNEFVTRAERVYHYAPDKGLCPRCGA